MTKSIDEIRNIKIIRQNVHYDDYKEGEYYIGMPWDFCYKIYDGNQKIGIIFLSETNDQTLFIEWIRLDKKYRGKGYLRSIIQRIEEAFPGKNFIRADTSKMYLSKYLYMGFEQESFDPVRKMYKIQKKIG